MSTAYSAWNTTKSYISPLSSFSAALDQQVRQSIAASDLNIPVPIQCQLAPGRRGRRELAGHVHRHAAGGLILELEPNSPSASLVSQSGVDEETLLGVLANSVPAVSAPRRASMLWLMPPCNANRELTGYDRVMVLQVLTRTATARSSERPRDPAA